MGAHGKSPALAIEVAANVREGHSELAVVAPDMPGVLAAIAGALAAARIDVLGAVLGHVELPATAIDAPTIPASTSTSATTSATPSTYRLVTDLFYVRDLKGAAIPADDPRWAKVLADLRELLADSTPDPDKVADLIARRRPPSTMPKRVTPGVITEIRLHDDSTQATIVEVFTRDRVGVLYAITQTLADLGLDITLAKVSTEGEKVADIFYVNRPGPSGRARSTAPAEIAAIIAGLGARSKARCGQVIAAIVHLSAGPRPRWPADRQVHRQPRGRGGWPRARCRSRWSR